MKTITVTLEEMENRIARFSQITPQSNSYSEEDGIPKEAYEMLTAKTLYLLMSPECQGGPMAHQPAVVTKDKMSVIIAECPPGDRPLLHAHHRTNETFFCLDGRFRIRWGDEGENQTFLEQYDMIAVPPGVVRDFTNISDKTARRSYHIVPRRFGSPLRLPNGYGTFHQDKKKSHWFYGGHEVEVDPPADIRL
jgi:mannose-6-phosphate isomerase-like protein (cupin superfamily)